MLFDPLALRSLTLKNRLLVSPMCQYSSDDGFANDWHLVHLGGLATGGASAVLTEAIAVTAEGRISPRDLGIWKDAHGEMLSRIARFVASQGAVPGVQLAHAGRKASTLVPWEGNGPSREGGWTPVAPSAVPFRDGWLVPEELDAAGIARIVRAFGEAAARAHAAEMRLIEIHAAHGYLLHEFLSPLSNHRRDQYGGSFDNRIRALREVVQAVRAKWPEELPIVVRISCSDWTEGGWTLDDSVALARVLREDGVDLIDCSSGGNVPHAKIPVGPGYQTAFAERIRREAGIRTGAVGMIRDAIQAEHILRTGQADAVFLARELLRNPRFPLLAAKQLGAEIQWPVQYERARD